MKTSLKIAIFIALLVAGERLLSFGLSRIPPAREGQCLAVSMDGVMVPVRLKVLKNDLVEQKSLVSINLGGDLIFGGWAKWAELRGPMNAERVSCE